MSREAMRAPSIAHASGLYVRRGTSFQQRGQFLGVKHRTAIVGVDHDGSPCRAFK